jgi:hypothetical protein
MLKGRFGNTSGRPFFSAVLSIPSLGIAGPISFLLDTGADCTVLMPTDAQRLGLNHSLLAKRAESYGVGGQSLDYDIEAIVSITDPGVKAYAWFIDLRVMDPHPALEPAPSLLGRDIIQHWRLTYDRSASLLVADVKYADAETDLL